MFTPKQIAKIRTNLTESSRVHLSYMIDTSTCIGISCSVCLFQNLRDSTCDRYCSGLFSKPHVADLIRLHSILFNKGDLFS